MTPAKPKRPAAKRSTSRAKPSPLPDDSHLDGLSEFARSKAEGISPDMVKILRSLPGYCPFETAEDCWFDEAEARKKIAFFPAFITHVKGSLGGKPFTLDPWEKAIVANIFGWKQPDGWRRYRKAFLYIPKGNGKTPFFAGLVIAFLIADMECGAEVYSAAATRQQASLIFEHASGMIMQNKELDKRLQYYTATKRITEKRKGATGCYVALASEAYSLHGPIPSAIFFDEVHAIHDEEFVNTLEAGLGKRDQAFAGYATTADFKGESICNAKLDRFKKVRDGAFIDKASLPVIYETHIDADWKDPKIWEAANPGYGVTVKRSFLESECRDAIENPRLENRFRRLYLNQQTESDVRWIPIEQWDACRDEHLRSGYSREELARRTCYVGVDLSSTTDLTAAVLYFPNDGHKVITYFWIPEEKSRERELKDRVPYELWASQGWLEMTPGNMIDYARIREKINKLAGEFQIAQIGFDRNMAPQIASDLKERDGFNVEYVHQGAASLNLACKRLEALIQAGEISHDCNPVMRWHFGNVMIEENSMGEIKPSKKNQRHKRERIDGVSALVNAVACAEAGAGETKSVYEDRGLLVF